MIFLDFVEIDFQKLNSKSYFVLKQKSDIQIIDYTYKILQTNQIKGMLPMFIKNIDDTLSFNYELGSKARLSDFLAINDLDENHIAILLSNLCENIKNLSLYLIRENLCIMDNDYVFIDSRLNPYFVVLPIKQLQDIANNTKEFFYKLLRIFSSKNDSEYIISLYNYVSQEEFNIEEFYKLVESFNKKQEAHIQISQNKSYKSINDKIIAEDKIEMPLTQEKDEKKEKKGFLFFRAKKKEISEDDNDDIIKQFNNDSFKKPFAEDEKISDTKKEKKSLFGFAKEKDKNEKAKKEKFSLFSKKKDKNNSDINKNNESVDITAFENKIDTNKNGELLMPNLPLNKKNPIKMPFTTKDSMSNLDIKIPATHQDILQTEVAKTETKNKEDKNNSDEIKKDFEIEKTEKNTAKDIIGVQELPDIDEEMTMMIDDINEDETMILDELQKNIFSAYIIDKDKKIAIDKSEFVIGKKNADYIIDEKYISRRHAIIIERNGNFYIKDEKSKNFTFLNSVQLSPDKYYELKNGYIIKLGIYELKFEM